MVLGLGVSALASANGVHAPLSPRRAPIPGGIACKALRLASWPTSSRIGTMSSASSSSSGWVRTYQMPVPR